MSRKDYSKTNVIVDIIDMVFAFIVALLVASSTDYPLIGQYIVGLVTLILILVITDTFIQDM